MFVCRAHRPSLTQAVSLVKTAAKALPPLGYSPLRGYSMLRGYTSTVESPDTTDTAAVAEGEHEIQPSGEEDGLDDTFELEPRNHVFYETTGNVGQVKVKGYWNLV